MIDIMQAAVSPINIRDLLVDKFLLFPAAVLCGSLPNITKLTSNLVQWISSRANFMLPVLFLHLKDTNFHMDKTSNQQDFSLCMEDLLIRCTEKDKRGYDIVFL